MKGKVREPGQFTKKTGFFEGQVVAINPDRESLEKILGTTLEKDPEYLSEDEGVTKLNLAIWLKDEKTGEHRAARFFLKDEVRENKDKTKKQYINIVGSTGWADTPENIPDWIKEKEFRPAYIGEEELYGFLLSWLNKLDTRDADATLALNWKKLMKGDVRELTEQIGGEYSTSVVCLVTIRTVEKVVDGVKEVKEYEQIYNRKFLPGYIMKNIRLRTIDETYIEQANRIERKKRNLLQKFVLEVGDSQYGIKDYYTLGELEDYDPSKNLAASDKAIGNDDTSY